VLRSAVREMDRLDVSPLDKNTAHLRHVSTLKMAIFTKKFYKLAGNAWAEELKFFTMIGK
jgi:hypothetical protein